MAQSNLYSNCKHSLAKDGKTHILMVHNWAKNFVSFTKAPAPEFDADYTEEIDSLLTCMQEDGYEILDVKFSMAGSAGSVRDGIHTLITYKAPSSNSQSLNTASSQSSSSFVSQSSLSPAPPKTEWKCKSCGTMNPLSRRSCLECGAAK